MKKYGFTKGFRGSKKKAQVYGRCLEDIEQKHGKVEPTIVVGEASDKSSPLHDYFDWNNTTAAEKYRLWQARQLINHLTVVVNYETGEEQKAFFSVSEGENGETSLAYVNIERALTEPELRRQVLENAWSEIKYWKAKYQAYSEFKGIIMAIRKTAKKFKKK